MSAPRLRAVVDGLASCRPTEGVHGAARLRPLSANETPYGPAARHRRRVEDAVAERTRVRAALPAAGWDVPDGQGDVLWLDLAEDAAATGWRDAGDEHAQPRNPTFRQRW